MAAASQTDRQTETDRPRPTTTADPQFGDVQVSLGSAVRFPKCVMVREKEEGNLSKLIIGGETKPRRLLRLFPPLSVCLCVTYLEERSSACSVTPHSHSLVFPLRRPLIFVKSSSGGRRAIELEQWNCGYDELRKMSPAEKKVRLIEERRKIDMFPRITGGWRFFEGGWP